MPPLLLHRYSPLLISAAIAVGGGLLGGATAVHGLRLNSYGDPSLPKPEIRAAAYNPDDNGCADCSDRTMGFNWASVRGIRSPADCPDDSWNFRRGCVDYARASGL